MADGDTEQRLIELESRVAQLQATLDELDEAVRGQASLLDEVRAEVKVLVRERLEAIEGEVETPLRHRT